MTWNEEAEHWIELARAGHDPSETDTRRVRRALIARGLVAGSVATTAGAAASATTLKALVVNAGAAIIVAGSVTTATTVFFDSSWHRSTATSAAAAAAATPERAASTAHPPNALQRADETPSAASSQPVGSSPPTVPLPTVPASPAPRAVASAGVSTLALEREIAGLRTAQQALHRGEAASAARALDKLEATNPDGALLEERLATRTILACSSGPAPGALRQFIDRYPSSVHGERVRAACQRTPAVGRFPETESTTRDH